MKPQSTLTVPKPKEHGAWGMLYVPLLTAVGIGGTLNVRVLLLALAVTLLFLSQRPYAQLLTGKMIQRDTRLRRSNLVWMAVYWMLSALLFGLLYFNYGLEALPRFALIGIPVAAAFTLLLKTNRLRTVAGELVGISGLTLTAPLAHYAAVGQMQPVGFWLWGLFILYFASSVFYIKAVLANFLKARSKVMPEKLIYQRLCGSYHLGLALLMAGLATLDKVPAILLVAFLPVVARGLLGIQKPQAKLNFARIGWTEVLYSVFFAFFTALAMRLETLAP